MTKTEFYKLLDNYEDLTEVRKDYEKGLLSKEQYDEMLNYFMEIMR